MLLRTSSGSRLYLFAIYFTRSGRLF